MSTLYTALGNFIAAYTALPQTAIIKGWGNRVAKPPRDSAFCVLSVLGATRTSTNVEDWNPETFETTLSMPVQVRVQIDLYSTDAEALCMTLATLLRSFSGCEFFRPYAVQPLYTGDPQNLTVVDGTNQYAARWMLEAYFAVHPQTVIGIDYFENVDLSTHPQL